MSIVGNMDVGLYLYADVWDLYTAHKYRIPRPYI